MNTACPHCGKRLTVVVRTDLRVVPSVELTERRAGPVTSDEVEALIKTRGASTVREIQRALQVPTADAVYAILEALVEAKRGEFVKRGRKLVFVLPSEELKTNIRQYLEREGCCSERELYRKLHASFAAMSAAVNLLIGEGVVKVVGQSPRMVHWVAVCTCDTDAPV